MAVNVCRFEAFFTKCPPKSTRHPLVLFLDGTSPAKSLSLYPPMYFGRLLPASH